MSDRSALAGLRVDGDRLLARLEALGRIGDTGDGGTNRLALTDADRAGRDLVVGWMRELDLEVRIDALGNVVGTRAGRLDGPAVLTGSHIDTVRTGGRYDGNLGVLAGLEIVETLVSAGVITDRPLAVGFFSNEEGSRFAPDMMGSLTYVGGMTVDEARAVADADGLTVGAELDRIGYAGPHPCPGPVPHAFVELHIEQGPILEAEGTTIGAVTGVQGISWQELTITGQSNHAGTTPMHLRHDAGYAAAAVSTFVRALVGEIGGHQVGTVGVTTLHPNLVNVIAASAVVTVDLRHTDEHVLQEAERRLDAFLGELADAEGVVITSRRMARFEPVVFDESVIAAVERWAGRFDLPVRRLPAGAGHDAQMFARVCPSGMVFVPSHRGISHNPAEHTEPADLTAGADVLLQVLLDLATTGEVPAP